MRQSFEITSEDLVQYLYLGVQPPETFMESLHREFCCWLAHHSTLRRIIHFLIAC